MKVFRIAKRQFIRDLSGEGARLFGGRWNRKGIGILYTSESRSLATVEYLVHLSMGILPKDLFIAEIEIPDVEPLEVIDVSGLHPGWSTFPAPAELSKIGSAWVQRGLTLGLRVPSSVIKDEWNILLNPNHPRFSEVNLISVEDYVFDQRLLRMKAES